MIHKALFESQPIRECLPTGPFMILELQDEVIGEFYVVQERPRMEFEAVKGSVGIRPDFQ